MSTLGEFSCSAIPAVTVGGPEVSILSPERTVTRTRPVQRCLIMCIAQLAGVRCRTPSNVVRNIRDRCIDANVAFHFKLLCTNETSERSVVAA